MRTAKYANWIERERRTARLLRACWPYVNANPTNKRIEGLIRLSWITKSKPPGTLKRAGYRKVIVDPISARTTTWQGLAAIFGIRVDVGRSCLPSTQEFLRAGFPAPVADAASDGVGFTHFYMAYRTAALSQWIGNNRLAIVRLFRDAAGWSKSDAPRWEAAGRVGRLPRIPRGGTEKGGCRAGCLLSPVLACLDPEGRFPVLNSASEEALRLIGLNKCSLEDQVFGMLAVMKQAGVADNMEMDWGDFWWDAGWVERAESIVDEAFDEWNQGR